MRSYAVDLFSTLMNQPIASAHGLRVCAAVCLHAQPIEDRLHCRLVRVTHHRVGEFLRNFQQRQRGLGCAVVHLHSHRAPLGLLVWWDCNCLEYLKHAT